MAVIETQSITKSNLNPMDEGESGMMLGKTVEYVLRYYAKRKCQ